MGYNESQIFLINTMRKFSIILALDNENGIWKDGDLAWKIPEDMKYFKDTTTNTKDQKKQNAVIMGRKTWESIPEKYRPFSWRQNFVLSRSCDDGKQDANGAYNFCSLENCLSHIESRQDIEEIFIIWWSMLYNDVLTHQSFEKAYITRIYDKFHCDVFFHGLPTWFTRTSRSEMKEHGWTEYEFLIYTKKKSILSKIVSIFTK